MPIRVDKRLAIKITYMSLFEFINFLKYEYSIDITDKYIKIEKENKYNSKSIITFAQTIKYLMIVIDKIVVIMFIVKNL